MWVLAVFIVKIGTYKTSKVLNCYVFVRCIFSLFFCSSAVVNGWPKLFAWFPETCCSHRRIRHRGHFVYETNIPPCCLLPRQPSTSSVCCHPTDWMPVSSCPIGFLSTIFEQFSAILLFAVAGTIFNAICIGIQHFHPSKSDKTSFSGLFSYKGISLWACGWTGVYGFEISLLETSFSPRLSPPWIQ